MYNCISMHGLTVYSVAFTDDDELSSRSATRIEHDRMTNSAVSVTESAVMAVARERETSAQTTQPQSSCFSAVFTQRRSSIHDAGAP